MDESKLAELNNVVTPEIYSLEQGSTLYEDADDELRLIANFIKKTTMHNEQIEPERIKFVYSAKPKKDGGRFAIGALTTRSPLEKIVNDSFDFVVLVYYKMWKELDIKHKVIQLDKVLSGVDMGTLLYPKLKKRQTDSREYIDCMTFYGPEEVMNSSNIVHTRTESILEEEKEDKKNTAKH